MKHITKFMLTHLLLYGTVLELSSHNRRPVFPIFKVYAKNSEGVNYEDNILMILFTTPSLVIACSLRQSYKSKFLLFRIQLNLSSKDISGNYQLYMQKRYISLLNPVHCHTNHFFLFYYNYKYNLISKVSPLLVAISMSPDTWANEMVNKPISLLIQYTVTQIILTTI